MRPGLGTGYGEEVESAIRYTTFKRSEGKPSSINMLYYNDKDGVTAMTNGSKVRGNGLQRSADGLVEWGVKTQWGYAKNMHSQGKRFVIGKGGASYSLEVKNICHSRLEVVMSVDGLDVMDGRGASTKKRGYIILPGETLRVKGFRTSEEAVAAFKFSSVQSSYSNLKHGTTRNVGVIGMAVFTEKGKNPWYSSEKENIRRCQARVFAEAPAVGAY
jgi:hypothetical protein